MFKWIMRGLRHLSILTVNLVMCALLIICLAITLLWTVGELSMMQELVGSLT